MAKAIKKRKKKTKLQRGEPRAIKRQDQIMDLVFRGVTIREIAEKMNLSVDTVMKDKKEALKRRKVEYDSKSPEEYYAEQKYKSVMRERHLWHVIIDKSASHRDRIQALRELREEDSAGFKRLQSQGFIPKDIENQIHLEKNELSQVNIYMVKADDNNPDNRGRLGGKIVQQEQQASTDKKRADIKK